MEKKNQRANPGSPGKNYQNKTVSVRESTSAAAYGF